MDVQIVTSGGQDHHYHRAIFYLAGVAVVWPTTGHITGVLRLCQGAEGCRARMDPGWSMIDIRSLATVQWDYLPEIEDAGMTPAYQAFLISHPFP